MAKAPVSLCMIVKNESSTIEKCLTSIRPYVQEIVIIDTGSNDDTPEVCKRFADKFEVYTECNNEKGLIEDFSNARNRSFSLASQPWIMWIDGDDTVRNAEKIPELIAKYDVLRDGKSCQIMLPYEYSHDHLGNVNCLHYRERIVTTQEDYCWVNPVHEVCVAKPGIHPVHFKTDDVKIIHHRNNSGKVIEPGRNLRILKKHYERVGDDDVRTLYYLGLEYGNNGYPDEAIEFHKKYIEKSGWDEEKFQACMKISNHYEFRGDHENAIDWALKSMIMREGWPETYVALCRNFYFLAQKGKDVRRNWERCAYYGTHALSLPRADTVLFINPVDNEFEVHRYMNVALSNIGRIEEAIDSCNKALSIRDDENLSFNKKIYETYLARKVIDECITKLIKMGEISESQDVMVKSILGLSSRENKENKLIQTPSNSEHETSILQSDMFGRIPVRTELTVLPADINIKNIIIFTGNAFERWNPETIKENGIGGSELMAYEVSRRLAKMGHKVTLYGDCSGIEGEFEGVQWLNYDKLNNGTECDVFITSRRPDIMDLDIRSKLNICWVHDVDCGGLMNHSRSLKINKFLCLTGWHREYFLNQYKYIHPDQVLITRNAIDISRFDHDLERNPKRAVYSSSPDRGLHSLLDSWPLIRSKVNDAELHIFYGFDNWIKSAKMRNDEQTLMLIESLKKKIKILEMHGVVYHGRVDQKTLAKEFLKSGVWAYPTWFSETSCQLAGSLIFTKNGMVPIENIKVGDYVLTHKGRFRKVTKLIEKNYDGDLYSIKRQKNCNPITVTEEHPLYSVSFHKNGFSKGNRVYSKNNVNYEWKIPSKINVGLDYLFTPKMEGGERCSIALSDYVDLEVKDGKICTNHNHSIYKSEDNIVELTEDLMYLFGLFAAEGSCSKIEKRGGVPSAITYAFHKNETDLIEKVKSRFGGEVVPNSENGVSIRFYNSVWGYFFINTIGSKRDKKIPDFVWECPVELQMAFANGMYDGDGTCSINPKGNGQTTKSFHTYTSVSPSLAYGFAQLLTNNGIYPSVTYCKGRDNYDVHWSEDPRSPWHQETDQGFATRIKSIEIEHYEGPVYNFEVEEDESYVTDRTVVHNCITAMEAQAAGLKIVTSPIAALNETVAGRGTLIPGDWLSKEYRIAFSNAVVDSMLNTKESERQSLKDFARNNFSFDSLCKDWDTLFDQLIQEVKSNVIPPYKSPTT